MNPLYWLDLRMRVREKKLWIVAVFFVVAMFVITAVVLATAFSAWHQRIVPANLGQGLVWAVLYTQAGLLLLLAPLAAAGRIAQ